MNINDLNGTYTGKVIEAGLGETNSGGEQAVLLCQLGGDGPEKGLRLNYYGSFHENSVDHTIKALKAAGLPGNDLSVLIIDPETGMSGWKAAVPNPPDVQFVIEPEPEYDPETKSSKLDENGQVVMRARVRWINAVGRLGVKTALAPDKAAAFAARMKGKMAAYDAANRGPKTNGAPPPKRSPPSEPAPATNLDDLPF
jgi:hypothetical protein